MSRRHTQMYMPEQQRVCPPCHLTIILVNHSNLVSLRASSRPQERPVQPLASNERVTSLRAQATMPPDQYQPSQYSAKSYPSHEHSSLSRSSNVQSIEILDRSNRNHRNVYHEKSVLPPSCSFEYHSTHSSPCNGHTTEYRYSQQTFLGDLVINEAPQTPCLQI